MTELQIKEQDILKAIGQLPRLKLAYVPTPLEDCPRLSSHLGGPRILVKREDLTGLAFGGNKARQLEFILGDALDKGADVIVSGASSISNMCRMGAAACAKLGLRLILLLRGKKEQERQGNLLLDWLSGAEIRMVEEEGDYAALVDAMKQVADALRDQGHKPYVMQFIGDGATLATIAYVGAALELFAQLDELGTRADRIYLCSGGRTQAGILLATKALGRDYRVVGIAPSHGEGAASTISQSVRDSALRLGLDVSCSLDEIFNYSDYVGEGFGVASQGSLDAVRLLAETEGIILDPVWTGKAMAGLVDHIRRGMIGPQETVVFVHTGGQPALFSYYKDFA